MRDSYVGDIGDFAKYGLLRAVGAGRRLGVAWYLCGDAEKVGKRDGRYIDYLRRPEQWRHLDCDLFDTLKGMVEEGRRSVAEIQKSGILGDAEFADDPVDAAGVPVPVRKREGWRRQWFDGVLNRLSACDLVFADPDNGLYADERFDPEKTENAKRIPLAEVIALAAGRTAIVYHHNGRQRGGHIREIDDWMSRIPGCALAWYWWRWSNRTFFIINPDAEMEYRVERFAERWRATGELVRAASCARKPVSRAVSMAGGNRSPSAGPSGTRRLTQESGVEPVSAAADNPGPVVVSRADAIHRRILDMLIGRYDQRIMNNTQRGDYVECMIASALGADWRLTSEEGWDWAAWDCEHAASGARLEIKQSAAQQTWDDELHRPRRDPRFDIRPRRGYWPKDGGPWVANPGRHVDVYVFGWHGEAGEHADHRDATQWRFFVVTEETLPAAQKSIGLGGLQKIAVPCGVAELARAVEKTCPAHENLKAARKRAIAAIEVTR